MLANAGLLLKAARQVDVEVCLIDCGHWPPIPTSKFTTASFESAINIQMGYRDYDELSETLKEGEKKIIEELIPIVNKSIFDSEGFNCVYYSAEFIMPNYNFSSGAQLIYYLDYFTRKDNDKD